MTEESESDPRRNEIARSASGMLTMLIGMIVVSWIVFDVAGLKPGDEGLEKRLLDAPNVLFTATLLSGSFTGLLAFGFSAGTIRTLTMAPSRLGWRGYLFGPLAAFLVGQSMAFLMALFPLPASETGELVLNGLSGPSSAWVAVTSVALVITSPIGEELFFRGFLLDSLNRALGSGRALLISAVFFGLIHFDPLQSFATTGLGLVLGLLAVCAGSLRPALFTHAVNNLVFVALVRFAPPSVVAPERTFSSVGNLVAALLTGALALVSLWLAVGGRVALNSAFGAERLDFGSHD